jgi:Fic family protein
MGRLWQTLLLATHNKIFSWIPMETVVFANREQYYAAIEESRKKNDCAPFIEFTLSALLDTIKAQTKHQVEHQDKHQVELTETHRAVLKSLKGGSLSRKEIFAALGMSGDTRAFKRNIEPLIEDGLIEMTVPDKPNSRLQKYKLTAKGRKAAGRVSWGRII